MFLVLLILSPDYLVIFAYLMMVWQLHSFYNNGYATLEKIFTKKSTDGKCKIIIVSFILFSLCIGFTILYILDIVKAPGLVLLLTIINFLMPTSVLISILYLESKFSGWPKREEYKHRLNRLNIGVFIWSISRYMRAVSSLWDANLFFGMMLELNFINDSVH